MRTPNQIRTQIERVFQNDQPNEVNKAVLEVLLDIREVLMSNGSNTMHGLKLLTDYTRQVEDEMKLMAPEPEPEPETQFKPVDHAGYSCDDIHRGISHEDWILYDYEQRPPQPEGQEPPDALDFGGAADQAAEARAEMATTEDNAIGDNNL